MLGNLPFQIKYDEFKGKLCDLKVVALLLGLQLGYTNTAVPCVSGLIKGFGDMDWIRQAKDKVKWWTTMLEYYRVGGK